MKSIELAKSIGKQYREQFKSEPFQMVEGRPLYKPEFILFTIERLQTLEYMKLNEMLEVIKK